MGTNYYLYDCKPCKHCNRGYSDTDKIHIGKSSSGWHFSLRVDPEQGINSLDDWKKLWNKPYAHIEDENGEEETPTSMLAIIQNRSSTLPRSEDFDYAMNCAEPGLNGLVRVVVDGKNCAGHGDGTYDYILGEFS